VAAPKLLVVLLLSCTLLVGVPSAATASPRPAYWADGCDASTPYRLAMFTGGRIERDLYLCTDYYGTRSLVVNVSRRHVWFLATHQEQPYWLPDLTEPLRIEMFRTAMRRYYGARDLRPLLTFEPGTRVILPYAPRTVRLDTAPHQQAAWQTVAMAASSANSLAWGAAPTVLGVGSPTRKAVVRCAISAYKSGDLLSRESAAYDLATVLGLGNQAAACSRALDRAKRKSGSALALSSDDLSRTAFSKRWLRKNGASIGWSFVELVAKRGRS
jgi:hypothetical protein